MKKLISLLFIFFSVSTSYSQTITGTLNFCQGSNTTLSVTGAPAGATYQWERSTDNGITWIPITPGGTSSTYLVSIAANYRVVINSVPTSLVDVIQNPNPTASFTFSPNNQCSNIPISFTNNSSGNNLTYLWNFGDLNSGVNNTSTNTNTSHEFIGTTGNSTQNFNVSLTATDINGCKNSLLSIVTTKQLPSSLLGGTGSGTYNNLPIFRKCNSSPTSQFDFTNQSTTTSTNASYKIVWGDNSPDYTSTIFSSPISHTYPVGIHTLLFIVTGSNGCSDTTAYNVFLGGNPAVGLGNPGNTAICTSSQLTFPISGTSTNPDGTLYTISVNDGTPSTLFTHPAVPSSITHTFNSVSCGTNSSDGSTNYTNSFRVGIVASNPCGTSSAAIVPIYVSQKPTASFTISPKDTICVNRTVTFTNTTLGKYVESGSCIDGKSVWSILPSTGWSLTSGSFGNTFGLSDPSTWTGGSNGLSISFNTVGVYSIKLKTGNPNCGIDSIIKTVCIIPVPTASFTLDKSDGCLPLVINTSATTNIINCGTNNFNWSVTYSSISGCLPNLSGFTYINSTNSNSQNPQLQFNNPGVYTINLVTISPGGICSSQIVSQQVTVKGKPNISFTSPSSLCQGLSFSPVSTVTCNVSTNSYLWSFPGGNPTNSTSANPGAIIYNTPGSYSISLTVTNECGSNILIKPIIINTAPASSTAGSNSPLCSGNTLNLTSSVAPAGATYSWTGPGGFTSTLQNPSRTNTTTAMSGAYNVTVNLNGCASTSSTVNVTINQTPTLLSVTTPINYCQGATAVQLTATASTGNTLLWYSTATGGTGSATAPTPLTTSIGTTTYYVSQVNSTATCESGRAAIVVNVGTIPSINGNSTNPTSCTSSNGTITLSGLTSNTTYSVQYTKNGGTPTIVNLIANSSGIITIANLSAGAYTNISAMLNGCPSNLVGPYTLVDPSAPASPIANATSPLCSGSTLNLNSTAAPTGGTYAWTGPGGFTSTLQNPSRANTTTAMSGTYSVTVNLNGCASTPATVNVTINQTPTLLTVTTPISYCQGATAMQLSATASTGNTLLWYNAATGGTGSSTAPTPLTTSIGTTTYYVSQVNSTATCESGRTAIVVNVGAIPSINGNSTNPTSCTSSNGLINLTGLSPNTTFSVQYIKDGGLLISTTMTSNGNGVITISNLSSGVYSSVGVDLNGCLSNLVGPYTLVDPSAPATPIASFTSPLCTGYTLNLTSSAAPAGATYAWTGPGGFTSTLQNPSRANATTAMSGTYSVTVNLNSCASLSGSIIVLVSENPIVDLGPDLLLDPSTVHTLASSIQNGPISTFVWSPSTYLSCTNCASPIANINSDITYSLKATNIYGCSGSDTIKIKVRCDNTQVYIPNAFTPDGDGINDLLIVRASGLVTIKYFRVFNRWGEMIFEKYNFPPNTSSFGWDGKIKGIVGPSDVFVYVAEVLCPNGSTFFYKGNTSILK